MKTALIGALVGLAACGGGAQPGATTETLDSSRVIQPHAVGRKPAAGSDAAAEHGEMAELPPEIKKFHDTLAPRWHAEHTPQRMADTCAALDQFHVEATAIVDAAPPRAADATAWTAGGKQLDAAVAALDATCKAKDAAAFEPAFERVHVSFHHVMEAGGAGEPEGPGAHGEHGEHDPATPDK